MIIVIARPPAMFLVPSSGGSFANRIGIVRIVRVDAHVEIIVVVFVRRRTAGAVARAGHVCLSIDRPFVRRYRRRVRFPRVVVDATLDEARCVACDAQLPRGSGTLSFMTSHYSKVAKGTKVNRLSRTPGRRRRGFRFGRDTPDERRRRVVVQCFFFVRAVASRTEGGGVVGVRANAKRFVE